MIFQWSIKHAWLWLIICVIAMLFATTNTFAQWEEIPSQGTTVDFAGTANNKAAAYTGTAIWATKNLWAGVQYSQIRADDEIKSEDLAARLQGGVDFIGISLQGFVEVERDMSSELTTGTGFYFRKVLEIQKLDIVLGVGSLIEREDVRADIGYEDSEATVLPYYLWSVGAEYDVNNTVGLHARVIAQPEGRFRHYKGTAEFGTDIVLSDVLTLKLQSTNEFSTDGDETEVDTENSAILSLNF